MKTVHDTFTMPEAEHSTIHELRLRCMKLGIDINKSEIVRCGLNALKKMSSAELRAIADNLKKIRAGRPPK